MNPSAASLQEARKAARRLAAEGKLDEARLERAVKLLRDLLNGDTAVIARYNSTSNSCNCPDAVERVVTCKHQLAIGMLEVAREVDSWSTQT